MNAVVARAGMAKGSFYTHFPDRTSYLRALHERFHDELEQAMADAMGDRSPGMERLRIGTEVYLDACRGHKAMKALFLEARTTPGLEAAAADRNERLIECSTPDLAVLGWPNPREIATLLVVTAAEIALAEHLAGSPRPDLRKAYFDLCLGAAAPDGPAGSPARRTRSRPRQSRS